MEDCWVTLIFGVCVGEEGGGGSIVLAADDFCSRRTAAAKVHSVNYSGLLLFLAGSTGC